MMVEICIGFKLKQYNGIKTANLLKILITTSNQELTFNMEVMMEYKTREEIYSFL